MRKDTAITIRGPDNYILGIEGYDAFWYPERNLVGTQIVIHRTTTFEFKNTARN